MTNQLLFLNATEDSNEKKPRRFFIMLFVVIILCLLFQWNLSRRGFSLHGGGDTPSYMKAAQNILEGNLFHHKRLPLYPIFLIVTQWGGDILTLVMQNLMAFACPIMLYIVMYSLWRSSILAALIAILSYMYYDNYIYTNYALAETLARFLVTLWATAIIISRKPKFIWLLLLPTVLCATKSQFWYVFLILYFFAAILRIESWKNCLIIMVCCSIVPLYYNFRASKNENSLVHNINTVDDLSVKQVLRKDHRWRLDIYPNGDPEIDKIRKLVNSYPSISYSNSGFYWYRDYFEKFIQNEGISKENAFEIFRHAQIKVFLFSLLCRPDIHLMDLCSLMFQSLDIVNIPQNETVVRKIRRWVRYSIEYSMGGLFILSFFASVFLLINGLRGKFEGLSNKLALLLPLFLLLYVFLLHYIEGQGGRHKIPIHDMMIFISVIWLKYLIEWVKAKLIRNEIKGKRLL